MKYLWFLCLFASSILISAESSETFDKKESLIEPELEHSMWIEPNYVDTQYSALFKTKHLKKIDFRHEIYNNIPFGWIAYEVNAEIIDVYKGDLVKNKSLSLLVYISALGLKRSVERISGSYLLSFCKSKAGIYYTSRDYLTQHPTDGNVKKFEYVRKNGTDYEGTGDCSGNYPSLNPDTHQN